MSVYCSLVVHCELSRNADSQPSAQNYWVSQNLYCNKTFKWFIRTLKLERNWSISQKLTLRQTNVYPGQDSAKETACLLQLGTCTTLPTPPCWLVEESSVQPFSGFYHLLLSWESLALPSLLAPSMVFKHTSGSSYIFKIFTLALSSPARPLYPSTSPLNVFEKVDHICFLCILSLTHSIAPWLLPSSLHYYCPTHTSQWPPVLEPLSYQISCRLLNSWLPFPLTLRNPFNSWLWWHLTLSLFFLPLGYSTSFSGRISFLGLSLKGCCSPELPTREAFFLSHSLHYPSGRSSLCEWTLYVSSPELILPTGELYLVVALKIFNQ